MDYICRLLSLDLYGTIRNLFNERGMGFFRYDQDKNGNCNCVTYTEPEECEVTQQKNQNVLDRPSYTIRHKYPKPLHTYDGEEAREPRLIRLLDLTDSVLRKTLETCRKKQKEESCECKEDEDEDEEQEKCEDEEDSECDEDAADDDEDDDSEDCEMKPSTNCCLMSKPATTNDKSKGCAVESKKLCAGVKEEPKCCRPRNVASKNIIGNALHSLVAKFNQLPCKVGPTEAQVAQVDQCAQKLYETWVCECLPPAKRACVKDWKNLKPVEKLRFYWPVLTGDQLLETPFENFKQSYINIYNRFCGRSGARQLKSQMREHWHCLDHSERLPFVMQALLYQVSICGVDPNDHCSVRAIFYKLRS